MTQTTHMVWVTIVGFVIGTVLAYALVQCCIYNYSGGTPETTVQTVQTVEPEPTFPRTPSQQAFFDRTYREWLESRHENKYVPSVPKPRPMPMKKKAVVPTNQECSICLDTISADAIQCCQCGHCFHKTCIESWLRQSKTCPLCRGKCNLNF